MRYLLVLLVILGLVSPASAESWKRKRDKARGRLPQKEPRRRVERPQPSASAAIRQAPRTSELAVRGRSQLHRALDRVSSSIRTIWSPDRKHIAQIRSLSQGAALFVDGVRVYPRQGYARLVGTPTWNPTSRSLAVLERVGRDLRLVVIPDVEHSEILTWRVPAAHRAAEVSRASQRPAEHQLPGHRGVLDRIFWAGATRLTIGEAELAPRAQVSFSVVAADGAE